MASIRILQFAGIRPELSPRLANAATAQIAHNCILTDGSLRPQANWVQLQEYNAGEEATIRGIAYNPVDDYVSMYASFDPVTLPGEPFASGLTVGASPNSTINWYYTGEMFNHHTVAVYPAGASATVSYIRTYDSIKPVNRIYALTRVRVIGNRAEEGPLIPIPGQDTSELMYEGDLVNVEINSSALDDGATHLRLYRSISGLDTGIDVTNTLDTEWHLVDQVPFSAGNLVRYTDGASATASPLDVCYSQNFHPPALIARYFGLSEGGWFVSGSVSGDIQISERYLHHAWPVDNHLRLQGEEITDLAVSQDNVYVGTLGPPYIVSLAAGEAGLQAAARPFGEAIPCLPNTLAPSAGGAIYASGQGLVSLSREGLQVISREVVNAGDVLYHKRLQDGRVSIARISNTAFGTYFQGKYIGFCEGPPIDDGVYLTSTLYPVEVVESIRMEAELLQGGTLGITTEKVVMSAEVISGNLRPLLQKYDISPTQDGLDDGGKGMHIKMGAEVISGDMPVILRSTVAPIEEVKTFGRLTNASLETILVSTTAPVEKVKTSGALVGASLT